MSDGPAYYTTAGLAEAAMVSRSQFYSHVKEDVGHVTKAKEKVPGLGVRWVASKCRKYIDLCQARTARTGRGKAS